MFLSYSEVIYIFSPKYPTNKTAAYFGKKDILSSQSLFGAWPPFSHIKGKAFLQTWLSNLYFSWAHEKVRVIVENWWRTRAQQHYSKGPRDV